MFDDQDDFQDPDTFQYFLPPDPSSLPIYIHPDREFKLTSKTRMEQLDQHLEKIKPVVVIFDPFYSLGPIDNYMTQLAEQMVALKKLRDKHGCAIIFVHHTTKSRDEENVQNNLGRNRLWGNQFLNAAQEFSWTLTKMRGREDLIYVQRRADKVSAGMATLKLEFHIQNDKLPFRYDVDIINANGEEEDVEYDADGAVNGLFTSETEIDVDEVVRLTNLSRDDVGASLSRLVKAGQLRAMRGGTYRRA